MVPDGLATGVDRVSPRGYSAGRCFGVGGRVRMGARRWIVLAVLLASGGPAPADAPPTPPDLPRYDLSIDIDPAAHLTAFRAKVTWTNPSTRPTRELVFNFYPMFRVAEADSLLFAKTLELLRLEPSYGLDRRGGHGRIARVSAADGTPLAFARRSDNQTAFAVELPDEVPAGGSVTVTLPPGGTSSGSSTVNAVWLSERRAKLSGRPSAALTLAMRP